MYSSACRHTKMKPSRNVAARKIFSTPRLPARSAWCAIVIVTPESSRMAVLIAGRPKAGIVSKVPPSQPPGHWSARPRSNSGHSSSLLRSLAAFAAEPGHRQLARVEQRAEERREEHHFGNDEPHHSHAERAVDVEVVEARLVLVDDGAEPAEEQDITAASPPSRGPARGPAVQRGPAPTMTRNSEIEPTIGQWLLCGT